MKIGKLSDSALKRSVIKEIKYKKENVQSGAGVGTDCAIFVFEDRDLLENESDYCDRTDENASNDNKNIKERIVTTTAVVSDDIPYKGKLAMHMAVNNLAAVGAKAEAVETAILFPGQSNEEELKLLVREMNLTAKQLDVAIVGGHTEITRAVRYPVVTVTGIGNLSKKIYELYGDAVADPNKDKIHKKMSELDIVVTKWIGLAGTSLAAIDRQKDLEQRFPADLVQEAIDFDRYLSVVPEAATAIKSNIKAMHDISKGGVLGALWEMAERFGVGLEIDLKKIPIRQETVEICNFLDLNPYELLSTGSMLMFANDGEALVESLWEDGINAAVIGKTTASNDRLVMVDDEKRFLTRPASDQILEIYTGK